MIKKRFDAFIEIYKLANLKENWDSYGAFEIDKDCMLESQFLIDAFFDLNNAIPIPSVVPCSNGHVQLEWHVGGVDLEIEVIAEDHYAYLLGDEEHQSHSRKEMAEIIAAEYK